MTLNTATRTRPANDLNRMTAMILGGVLLLVGLLGFVMDPVLGIFEVGLMHNIVHLLTGAVLLAAAFMNNGAHVRMVNMVLGVTYLVVALLGFVAPSVLGAIIDFNMADNWLHVLLGVVLVGVAFAQRDHVHRPAGGAIR